MRGVSLIVLTLIASPMSAQNTVPNEARDETGLQEWIAAFRPKALAVGVSAGTFDTAMSEVIFAPEVVKRDRNQSEFTKTIWDYLETAVSDLRISNGKAALKRQQAALNAIEAKYGDVESMKQELSAMSVGVQGSGWGWLGYNSKSGKFFKIMILSRFSLPSTLNLYITPCCFFGMLRIH